MQRRTGTPGLYDIAVTLGLPRVSGTAEDVARDLKARALAKSFGVVYVSAYVRRKPRKRRRLRRAA